MKNQMFQDYSMSFTCLNIPVRIHSTFWIFLIFFTQIYEYFSIESVILGLVMMFSLLVHEYGHALTAVYFGAKPTINLYAFGGNAQYNDAGMTRTQQFFITLNGPLFEGLLIAISYFLLESDIFNSYYYVVYTLYVTMQLNIIWCLFNLIPVAPLDGGRMMCYLLQEKFQEKGYTASLWIGLASVVLITPFLFYEGFNFFAAFLIIFGIQNIQKLRDDQSSNDREEAPFASLMKGLRAMEANDPEEAKKTLQKLLKSKDDYIKYSAIESLAKIYFHENELEKSYNLLLKNDHRLLKEGKCLLCKLAFKNKNYKLIGEYSRDIYSIDPTYEIALLNAKAFANMNQPGLAGAWLATASKFGVEFTHKVVEELNDPSFDLVRSHDSFIANTGLTCDRSTRADASRRDCD